MNILRQYVHYYIIIIITSNIKLSSMSRENSLVLKNIFSNALKLKNYTNFKICTLEHHFFMSFFSCIAKKSLTKNTAFTWLLFAKTIIITVIRSCFLLYIFHCCTSQDARWIFLSCSKWNCPRNFIFLKNATTTKLWPVFTFNGADSLVAPIVQQLQSCQMTG